MAWVDANAEVQKLKHWELLTGAPSQAGEQLAERVEQMELTHLPCSVVLGTEDYDLQLVELPNVPTSERAAAVKFLLKDKIRIPLDDLDIQLFDVPNQAYPQAMGYAVAAARTQLIEVRDLVLAAGLTLERINIRELATRDVALSLTPTDEAFAVLDVRDGQARLMLLKSGQIFLCRNLSTRIDRMSMAASDWAFNFERFIVELQRSLDFFENQMRQGQVLSILVAPVPGITNQLIEQLNLNLVATASALDLNSLWGTGRLLSAQDQHDLFFALGATLREAA